MRPVFYDPSGRRRRMTRRTVFGLLLTLLVAAVIFATTVVNVPAPSPLSIGYERMTALPFRAQISRIKHRIVDLLHRPAPIVQTRTGARPLTIAFYSAEADNSVNTLLRNINEIDWVAPTLLTLDPAGQVAATDDPTLRRVVGNSLHRPAIVPVIQNIQNEQWEGAGAARLMADPARRARLVASINAYLARTGDAGVIYDFESLPAASMPDLVRLVADTRAALAPHGKVVGVTMPIDDAAWPARDLAQASDRLILMAYDEHWQGGVPGPIASDGWFAEHLARTLKGVPGDKVVVALGNYA